MTRRSWRAVVAAALVMAAGCSPEQGEQAFEYDESLDGVYQEGPALDLLAGGKADALGGELPAYAPLPADARLDGALEALFAPDDPVTTLELTLIDEVIAARSQDERAFDEGENPYAIRYAVYNLRNPQIVSRLADAEDAGVDVQILIESHQLDPKKDWNTADEALIARGFEFAESHRELSVDELRTADLIGIQGSGLMHLKTRLFSTPEGTRLLTGSINPGDNAVLNEETLHLINDPTIIARYEQAYAEILTEDNAKFVNTWDDEAAVNVMFTPAEEGLKAGTKVLDWIEEEDEQILLMIFSLRDLTADGHDDSLVDLLGQKVREGVPVYVITDRKQSDGEDAAGNRFMWNDRTDDRLREAGVPVYEAINNATDFTAMHHKVAILGRTNIRVITDAANWTKAGLGAKGRRARNIESQLFIDSARLDGNRTGRRYMAQWMRVLERYAPQSMVRDREAPFDTVFEALTSSADWPTQPVVFTAYDARTQWGERVFVRGAHGALGAWGAEHDGVMLDTDEDTYPDWQSASPVMLPLGVHAEWKMLIRRSTGAFAWEPGENRVDFIQPDVLTGAPEDTLDGAIRF